MVCWKDTIHFAMVSDDLVVAPLCNGCRLVAHDTGTPFPCPKTSKKMLARAPPELLSTKLTKHFPNFYIESILLIDLLHYGNLAILLVDDASGRIIKKVKPRHM